MENDDTGLSIPDDYHADADHGDEVQGSYKGTVQVDPETGQRSIRATHVSDKEANEESPDMGTRWKALSDKGFSATGGIFGSKGIGPGSPGAQSVSSGAVDGSDEITSHGGMGAKLMDAINKYSRKNY